MRDKLADFTLNIKIPRWTRKVGQRWDTFDKAPYNLYNILWIAQQNIIYFIARDPRK